MKQLRDSQKMIVGGSSPIIEPQSIIDLKKKTVGPGKFEKSPELKTLMYVYPYTHNMHTSISVCIHVDVLTMYIIRLLNRAEKRRTRTYYQSLATGFPSLLVPSLTSASLFAFRKARLSEMRRPGSCRLRKGVISEWVGCESSAKCQIRRGASVKQPNHQPTGG